MTVTAALADSMIEATDVGSYLGAGLIVALVAVPLVFFIAALVSVLGSPLGCGVKLLWIVFAFCAPLLGPLLWFLLGKRSAYLDAR
ncbi:PLDc N-terminal domain-containing protein [Amycolatopsis jiangsuensis]|uniref:Cardiolipin synthase N-terminal domain-containing protein n=1 Tax=Amycolatopsis jiangsuensis TaxID=1181879 RepID=A0A840IUF4_9PSEU|nr:PLDc N-terminal domain-containing protein [Amycolatopsis jiangsuensis]MBB4685075.1 hypothetical protein [Amycolatopsis jiangsuensis]